MKGDIVLIIGFPASGKTSLVSEFPGYDRLNRDTIGGTLEDISIELDKRLRAGKTKFVLDNTYSTKKSRKVVVDVAAKHGVEIRCIRLGTSIEDSQYNACKRMVGKYGKILGPEEISAAKDPNTFPPVVLFKYQKEFEIPDRSEGFSVIETRPFIRNADPSYKGKAVIFDYDGTLRKTKSGAKYPCDVADVEILPGRKESLAALKKAGFLLLGVSNQSGVAKGDLTLDTAKACFDQTNKLLGFDIEYAFCPHRIPPITCFCRKPMPGLGVWFIEKHKLDRTQTTYVGDMTSDKTFAFRSGIKFALADEFFQPN